VLGGGNLHIGPKTDGHHPDGDDDVRLSLEEQVGESGVTLSAIGVSNGVL